MTISSPATSTGSGSPSPPDEDGEPGSGPTLYLKVDDIDDCYGAVLAHGFTPSTEPRKDRSGRREFILLHPDGNRLAFFGK